MKYEKLIWDTAPPDHPLITYSEIDDERWETRKVEIFRDKPPGYADLTECLGSIGLSEVKLRETVVHRELKLIQITAEEFEDVWAKAKAAHQNSG